MNMNLCIAILILSISLFPGKGFSSQPHEFTSAECTVCHEDEKNDPYNLRLSVNDSCVSCHQKITPAESHPTDAYVYYAQSVPKDMPLLGGRVVCMTCHITHPGQGINRFSRRYLLRRNSQGADFCISCHKNDRRNHITMGKAHMSPGTRTGSIHSIDRMSVLCLECHNSKISDRALTRSLNSAVSISRLNHPVGVPMNAERRHAGELRPAFMLNKVIKLFNGKIGCGTCHNIYSANKYLLVIDNRKSRLCLECHIK